MVTALSPPGPKSKLPGGLLLAWRRHPLAFFTRLARDYGDPVYFKLGSQEMFLLNEMPLTVLGCYHRVGAVTSIYCFWL